MSMNRPQMDPPPFNDEGPGFRQPSPDRQSNDAMMLLIETI
jgi:hypothetical protein